MKSLCYVMLCLTICSATEQMVKNPSRKVPSIKNSVIPSDYTKYENFGWLKAHEEGKLSWDDAQTSCINEGGDLVIPGHNLPTFPHEFKLIYSEPYWIGVFRETDIESPFQRVGDHDETPVPDDSPLWYSYWGEPSRGESEECVFYSNEYKLLFDDYCNPPSYFICQIFDE